jgi:hypothetical protein
VMSLGEQLRGMASADLFTDVVVAEAFVGRPFYFDFAKMKILSNDYWKERVGGIAAGTFLLAVYDMAPGKPEVVLLRVLGPTALPSDSDVVAAMVDHYKENAGAEAPASKLDSYTRYEFQFSGLECRVLGSFYRDASGRTQFGADVDNFFSPNNYSVYRPSGKVLETIVNFRDGTSVPGGPGDQRIGEVRYASSRRHAANGSVPVYVSALDYLGKRTALFGMTRTGKSNTVKMIIQATAELETLGAGVGQIVFDVNGEYANANPQDVGGAVFEMYPEDVTRYSVLDKPGFRVMKLNFYRDLEAGFSLVQASLAEETAGYMRAFANIDWEEPDRQDRSAHTRWERRVACYHCVLHAAGFRPPTPTLRFAGNKDINAAAGVDPAGGVPHEQAAAWFEWVWENYDTAPFFQDYRAKNHREWADPDLKSLLQVLTQTSGPGGRGKGSQLGYRKLVPLRAQHTPTVQRAFELEIVELLRAGKIVIIDLSQGDPEIQRMYSDRLCTTIFRDAMDRFIENRPGNTLQMYFEEAHNLFPKKNEADLTNIYNRIAKEGAKLGLGLVYATQEVSSISANVLKNTQNWFVSHLNNRDELREIAKYYDFEDFEQSLRRATDKGFIRMKTYSNAFIVPVQIDRFRAAKG